MRVSISSSLLGGFVMLVALCVGTARPAQAQVTLNAGECTDVTEADFSPGLRLSSSSQNVVVTAILAGCVFPVSPAPVKFTWSGTLQNAGCTAISNQTPSGSGTLTWENGQTSTIEFTSLTYVSAGAAPALITFKLTGGYQAGGTFVAQTTFVPSPSQVLSCTLGGSVSVLTGISPVVTFTNVSL